MKFFNDGSPERGFINVALHSLLVHVDLPESFATLPLVLHFQLEALLPQMIQFLSRKCRTFQRLSRCN